MVIWFFYQFTDFEKSLIFIYLLQITFFSGLGNVNVEGKTQYVMRLRDGVHVSMIGFVVKMVSVIQKEFVGALQIHLHHLFNVNGV